MRTSSSWNKCHIQIFLKVKKLKEKQKQPRGNWMAWSTHSPALWVPSPICPLDVGPQRSVLILFSFTVVAFFAFPRWPHSLSGHLHFHMWMISHLYIQVWSWGPCSAPDLHTKLHTGHLYLQLAPQAPQFTIPSLPQTLARLYLPSSHSCSLPQRRLSPLPICSY